MTSLERTISVHAPINATGTIFYGDVGGPPLAEEAIRAVNRTARFCTEQEPQTHGASLFHNGAVELLCNLTKAEDALVVNNIQAASFLVLNTLVRSGDVVVSGEELLLEGFSSSLFGVLGCSGAHLKKLSGANTINGCADAGEHPTLLLSPNGPGGSRAGPKTGAPGGSEGEKHIPAVRMLSHASLVDLTPFGVTAAPQVQNLVRNYDVVVFGGDKLLGGPAVGIIIGRRACLSLIGREVLARTLGVDRMAVTALEATLEQYLDEENVWKSIPLLRMMSAPVASIEKRARRMVEELNEVLQGLYKIWTAPGETVISDRYYGLGTLPSFQVAISSPEFSARELSGLLYKGDPPVVPRLHKDRVLLDLRSVSEEDDVFLLESVIASLRWKKKREAQVLDTVASPIWVLDRTGRFVFANRACRTIWGMEPENLLGRNIDEVVEPEIAGILGDGKNKVLETGEETRIECLDGRGKWLDIILTPVNGERGMKGVAFAANDVTERKNVEAELKYISMHDFLTGLYNRAYFEEEMQRIDTKRHYPISVVICDVDGLKLINDTLGHEKGDELLKAAAGTIRKLFRASDLIARLGGDEFALILPQTDEQAARVSCERIRHAVDQYNQEARNIPLSLSVGFATGTDPSGGGIKEIYNRADSNMYENKYRQSEGARKKIFNFFLDLVVEKGLIDHQQTLRLQRMAQLLGHAVGLGPDEIKSLLLLSRVYDVGKIVIPDSIISKDGALTEAEWEEVRRHAEIGGRIARFSPETDAIADYVVQHHERWDGSGYPQGLKGRDIHLYSRILAVVDAYQAMTSPRPYREPLSHEAVIEELEKAGGTQFDPRLVDIFVGLFNQDYLM